MSEVRSLTYGVVGEFSSPKELKAAARKLREAGFTKLDAYVPFPVEGLSEALGLGFWDNLVPQLTLLGGLGGGLTGFFFQLWVNMAAYPLNVGGRPLNSWPAFIPVTFELTVLGASTFAVFGMLALNGLPQPYHPIFNAPRFERASTDGFFLCIEATDPKFAVSDATRALEGANAKNVSEVREDED